MPVHWTRRAVLGLPLILVAKPLLGISSSNITRIYVQPLGPALPRSSVALVEAALGSFFAVDVRILPMVAVPKSAYYPKRKRYRAERLLETLAGLLPADGQRILGLTAADISTSNGKISDWGVLGLGSIDGSACVISSFRAGRAVAPAIAEIRLAKVAVHEIGHTFGLSHCPTHGCIMHDAEGKIATTDSEYDLCAICRKLLTDAGRSLPDKPKIPWPKP